MGIFDRFRNINAGGDFVGRDKITNQILHEPAIRQLDVHSANYLTEVKNNTTTSDILAELRHFRNAKSEVRDLSQKLTEAGFEYLLEDAEELKELVAKLIITNQNYKSAQKIITLLLSNVESIFNSRIKPKLNSIKSESEVKSIFREYLEQEIQDTLGNNVLEIFNRQINGMVFFLTGNCHLEWQ